MRNNRRNFRITFAVGTVLLLGIAVLVTSILGNFGGARLDLTSDKLFTMSPAAHRMRLWSMAVVTSLSGHRM